MRGEAARQKDGKRSNALLIFYPKPFVATGLFFAKRR
jgi:hypothetical protein